jgi:formate dehydrogenase subunit gamma
MVLAFAVMLTIPATAQHINPTADSVNEEQLLGELKRISGECSIPDQKACTVEQPAGRDWRHFHEVTLRWIGAVAIVGMLALLVLFYLVRGMVRIDAGRSGRVLVRSPRAVRALEAAVCFII